MVNLSHNCDHKHEFFLQLLHECLANHPGVFLAACSKAGGKDTELSSHAVSDIKWNVTSQLSAKPSTPFYRIEKS